MEKCSIFVISHKEFKCPISDILLPIQVGKCNTGLCLDYLQDDIGDNISSKNSNYCELTAMYWAWKNYECDIIGICHYRRFFINTIFRKDFISKRKLLKDLQNYDMLLRYPTPHFETNEQWFVKTSGKQKDMDLLKKVVSELFPEYLQSLDKVLNSNSASYCNMMICRKNIYNAYCEWLFAILFEMEKHIDLKNYSQYEARIFGFIAELLLNVFVEKNSMKVCYYPVDEINNLRDNKAKHFIRTNCITKRIYDKYYTKKYMN